MMKWINRILRWKLSQRMVFFTAGYFLLFLVWLIFANPAGSFSGMVSLLFRSVPKGAAVWLAFRILSGESNRHLKAFWGFMLAGCALWFGADLLRILLSFTGATGLLSPSWVEGMILAGYALAGAGFYLYPIFMNRYSLRLRLLLDMTISAGAFMLLSWVVFILPIIPGESSASPAALWPAALPAADMTLFMLAFNVTLIAFHPGVRRYSGYFSLSMLVWTIGDLASVTLTVRNGLQNASFLDFFSVLGGCLLVLGFSFRVFHSDLDARTENESGGQKAAFGPQFQAILPMAAALALVIYLLVVWQTERLVSPEILWLTALIWLLLIARQGVAAGEFELEQYAALVNFTAEPVFICNADGKLTLVNPALIQVTRYENENELIGEPLSILFSDENLPGGFRNPRYFKEQWVGEGQIRRKDGTRVPVEISLQPIPRRGLSRSSLAGTAHDLSEQKRQQEELVQAYEKVSLARSELEELNQNLEMIVDMKTRDLQTAYHQLEEQNQSLQVLDQVKSDFVSMVSHELRAPLTNISGGVELVLARDDSLTENTRESLRIVQSETQRLAKYVDTILDLSALEAGRIPLYPAPVSAADVVNRVIRQFSQFRDVDRLQVSLPEVLSPVLADENALTSVLFHLIDNAMKYAPEGIINVTAGEEEKKVFIHIRDHGPGIPPDQLALIYDKFTRLNAQDSQTVYGYGLGLYIVKRLLDEMKGAIRVENMPEGGACFTFWLPQAEVEDGGKNTFSR